MPSALRNTPHLIKDTPDITLYALPQGKPDTSVPFKKGEMHLRPLVEQSDQKGSTCFFYALNILRERIGPNAPVEYQKKREFEVLYSGLRKAISQEGDLSQTRKVQNIQSGVYYFFQESYRIFLNKKLINQSGEGNLSKKDYFDLLDGSEKLYPPLSQSERDVYYDVRLIVDQFFNQSEEKNLFKFAERQINKEAPKLTKDISDVLNRYKKQSYDLCVKFNSENKIKLNGIVEIGKNQVPLYPKWEALYFSELFILFRALALQTFDFKVIEWNPTEPVDKLQCILKDKGPLLVSGDFGSPYYYFDPSIKHKIAGKSIYGWRPNDFKIRNPSAHHAIVVIGAAQGGSRGGFVYFVDPNDGSSPNHPDQQKIYVMSYRNFVDNITDSCGCPFKEKGLTSNGYAFYHSKENSLEEPRFSGNQ